MLFRSAMELGPATMGDGVEDDDSDVNVTVRLALVVVEKTRDTEDGEQVSLPRFKGAHGFDVLVSTVAVDVPGPPGMLVLSGGL